MPYYLGHRPWVGRMKSSGMDDVTAEIFAVTNMVKSKLDRSTPVAGAIDQEPGCLKRFKKLYPWTEEDSFVFAFVSSLPEKTVNSLSIARTCS